MMFAWIRKSIGGIFAMNRSIMYTSWFVHAKPRTHAKLRLFCFASAGHGGNIYTGWNAYLPSSIELYPLELPGRGPHITRPAYTHLAPLIDEISFIIRPALTKPFAFFGHSMGGLVAFTLASQLRRQRLPEPVHLFVSATHAPHLRDARPKIHHLPEAEFLAQLQHYQGDLHHMLGNSELKNLMLPTLRADFSVCETYTYTSDEPLTLPISAYGGLQDQTCSRQDLVSWQYYTNSSFNLHMFEGDHFYWFKNTSALVTHIARIITAQYV